MLTRLLLVRFCAQLKFLHDVEADIDSRLTLLEFGRNDSMTSGINVITGVERPSPFATKEDKADASKVFINFREHAEKFAFDRTANIIGRFERLLKGTNVKLEDHKHQMRALHDAIEDDARRLFFYTCHPTKSKGIRAGITRGRPLRTVLNPLRQQ
jgi:hypothetical protein